MDKDWTGRAEIWFDGTKVTSEPFSGGAKTVSWIINATSQNRVEPILVPNTLTFWFD